MTSACPALVALLAAASPPTQPQSATLSLANRDIVTFRATVVGNEPSERATIARQRIDALPPHAGDVPVTTEPLSLGGQKGFAVLVDGRLTFYVMEGDRDPTGDDATAKVAAAAAERLAEALRALRDQRSLKVVLRGVAESAAATAVLALALSLLVRIRRVTARALARHAHHRASSLLGGKIDLAPVVGAAARTVAFVLFWSLVVALLDFWLTFVLSRFPVTAPWADALTDRALGLLWTGTLSVLRALPGLLTVVVIMLLAHFAAGFVRGVFDRIERGSLAIPGLYPETVAATRRIVSGLVWLVAVAAAYPYIPGADSEAVKGLSILVGVVLSLGSTGLVSQAMSGLALVYSRALSKGDVVRVGDVEGVVTQVGLLSTKLLTVPGEEVTFPNSVVLNGSVKNYSRLSGGGGPLVTTSVTIGYDAPWRRVHALLVGAAGETPGIAKDPAPFVLQRTLGDFYVEYQLLARLGDPSRPEDRPGVVSALHARVQDAFNAAGVQIMSPHFVLQPREPVVVPPERWEGAAPAPAAPAEGKQRQRG